MLAYQVSRQIVQGQFPLNRDLAFELAALMAQVRSNREISAASILHFYRSRTLEISQPSFDHDELSDERETRRRERSF